MTGSALVNVFNLSMRAVFGLNLSANVSVAGNAEGILSGLQRLVAAAALAFELGVGSKAFQRRLLAAFTAAAQKGDMSALEGLFEIYH